ncbi:MULTISPECIES: COP23 domain-containing protein [Arthrospira]|jgi:hypothetical protein|uniref:Circadian oscillating protein COP23 n=2 Tax=Limnospira platensis TaxID=118562 RepID=A0A5M3T176_LIMPL|nr:MULTISPECIES: COP23 domain-containing protein [Arthrospira]AMW30153.1 hypothetical protein AP285_21720 [Arthrospira platensis YZ]KDR54107.1 hypothetical protein APPUASWS_031690 [Arthrospira platensis str. Paraca]MBD2670106.1 hypothetical protein [Arthrospira platensis FACHB-439]MBD2709144.1 hypothetical protein [Arthrospira platensis FACHB-835]MDF2207951.1 COP23 domain-containing protein [Arthrospira platensis NCB002]MDT9184341.1 COP23 domain-containing protein [Limnospira sp. PMC 289.06]
MQNNTTVQLATVAAIALGSFAVFQPPDVAQAQVTSFYCDMNSPIGYPTVYARTPAGNKPIVSLYSEYFSASGYSPERRCQEIAQRFTNFSHTGQLRYLTAGYVNNLPVICVVSDHGMPCASNTILFTMKADDPEPAESKLQRLFNIRRGASDILFESEDDAGVYINFDQFLGGVPAEAATPTPTTPSTPPSSQPGTAW